MQYIYIYCSAVKQWLDPPKSPYKLFDLNLSKVGFQKVKERAIRYSKNILNKCYQRE